MIRTYAMTDEIKDVRVTVLMAPSELVPVDHWRRHQDDLPNRSEAIRRLIATGIKAEPILRDVMKMLVELRGAGPTHELDQHIEAIMEALGKEAPWGS